MGIGGFIITQSDFKVITCLSLRVRGLEYSKVGSTYWVRVQWKECRCSREDIVRYKRGVIALSNKIFDINPVNYISIQRLDTMTLTFTSLKKVIFHDKQQFLSENSRGRETRLTVIVGCRPYYRVRYGLKSTICIHLVVQLRKKNRRIFKKILTVIPKAKKDKNQLILY